MRQIYRLFEKDKSVQLDNRIDFNRNCIMLPQSHDLGTKGSIKV